MEEKQKKKSKKILLFILAGVAIIALVVGAYFLGRSGGQDDPNPTPDPDPISNPIVPDDPVINTKDLENGTTIVINDIEIEITVINESEAKEIINDESLGKYVSGYTKDAKTFEGRGDNLIVSSGNKKIKAETKKNPQKADPAQIAGIVSASLEEEPYDEHTKDWNMRRALYFIESAECNFYYPAQFRLVSESAGVIKFEDTRSYAELIVRIDNPSDGIISADYIPRDTYSERNDYRVMISQSENNGCTVTASMYFPDKYSYVFDTLAGLMRIEFLESNMTSLYVYQNVYTDASATAIEMQDIFFPYYECNITIPLEFEMEDYGDDYFIFKDTIRDFRLTVSFAETYGDSRYINVYNMFDVVAEDEDIIYGEYIVKWHNGEGIQMGAVSREYACLVSVEGADSWDSYYDCFDRFDILFSLGMEYKAHSDLIRDKIAEKLGLRGEDPNPYDSVSPYDVDPWSDPEEIIDPWSDPEEIIDPWSDPEEEQYPETYDSRLVNSPNCIYAQTPFARLGEPDIGVTGNLCSAKYEATRDNLDILNEILTELDRSGNGLVHIAEDGLDTWCGYIGNNRYAFICYFNDQLDVNVYTMDEYPAVKGDFIIDGDIMTDAHLTVDTHVFSIDVLGYDIKVFRTLLVNFLPGQMPEKYTFISRDQQGNYVAAVGDFYNKEFVADSYFALVNYVLYEISSDGQYIKAK